VCSPHTIRYARRVWTTSPQCGPNTELQSNSEKTTDEHKLRSPLQNNWQVHLYRAKVKVKTVRKD
jgi:hypothetical protein